MYVVSWYLYCSSKLRSAILLPVMMGVCGMAFGEKLPLRHFTTQEGLASNAVNRIVRDSHGLLWFCTNEGLSRFDGHRFVTAGSEQGLGDQEITDLLETSGGIYWIGTARGISRLNRRSKGDGTAQFTNFLPSYDRPSQWILKLLEDRHGRIWIATTGGLYQMKAAAGQDPVFKHIPLPRPAGMPASKRLMTLVQDRFGDVWVGGDQGLYRIFQDGGIESYSTVDGLSVSAVLALTLDKDGDLWAGLDEGLCQLRVRKPGRAVLARVYTRRNGLPDNYVAGVHASGEWLWAGTLKGLVRVPVASTGGLQVFGPANGLRRFEISSFTEDLQGNLWIGTMDGGASRLSMSGFTTYGLADGLASVHIVDIVETNTGELCVISTTGGHDFTLNKFDGERFVPIRPRFPLGVTQFGWGWAQVALQEASGEWWIATSAGAVRYPRVSVNQLETTEPHLFLRTFRELPPGTVFRVFSDSRSDLWISTSGYNTHGLMRWERRTGHIQRFLQEDGLPGGADDRSLASAFAEDTSGTLWIGFHRGGLFRYRGGRLQPVLPHKEGLIEGVRCIHGDAAGRLWIGGRKGLLRVDDPGAEQPAFRYYGTVEGLSGVFVHSITEDHLGRIYVGTGHGVDRLDPATGEVRHYGVSDGLAGGEIRIAHCDRKGYLWFASTEGLSRYDPRRERPAPAPDVYISQVRVGSYAHELDYPAAAHVSVPPLRWTQNSLYVEFMGVGEGLRYEYQLEGADTSWSQAKDWRSANYSGLGTGSYRFLVRAVNPEGIRSLHAAAVQFRIKPPFWQTWWFELAGASIIFAAAFTFHRMQLAKAVAVERVRHRIAKDLHDDVGASLWHAALLSDIVQRENPLRNWPASERLKQISSVCREAVESMSDIVWAVDTKKDKVGDLVQRMRITSAEMLESRGLKLRFTDSNASNIVLDPEVRYQVFLIFKEAIHNVVQHSRATRVDVEVSAGAHVLNLRIADNGRGLPSESGMDGIGLRSMHDRVTALGGEMRVSREPHAGAIVEFTIPLPVARA
jgi:ligand-binding sensor domain-containing protein/signal transduction histidine kinase